jgi:hypothetical protein
MIARRNFLKASLAGGISWLSMPLSGYGSLFPQNSPGYSLSLDSPAKLFDGKICRAHPRAGIVPGAGRDGLPRVVMTMNLSEWMQPAGVEKYGSDGTIFIARIHWDQPNNLFVRS